MPLPSWPSWHHKGKGTLTTASAEDVLQDWSGLFIPLRKAEAEGGRVPGSFSQTLMLACKPCMGYSVFIVHS